MRIQTVSDVGGKPRKHSQSKARENEEQNNDSGD
jgi:hypothetical protein